MDLCTVPQWALDELHLDCADLMNVKHFDAMMVDSKNLVMYDRNCLKCDTASNA